MKINNYEKFLEIMKTVNSKDFNTWNISKHFEKPSDYFKSTKDTLNKIKNTPLLDWLNDKGYTLIFDPESYRNRPNTIKYIGGMYGDPYTFFILESYNEKKLLEYLKSELSESELSILLDRMWDNDISNAEILGHTFGSKYEIIYNRNKKTYDIWDIARIGNDEWDDIKDNIEINIEGIQENIDYDIYPFFGVNLPVYSDGSNMDNRILEMGLSKIKDQINIFLKVFNVNNYYDLVNLFTNNKGVFDYNFDVEEIIKYLNLNNMNIRKNDDLRIASKLSDNIRLCKKLIYRIHKDIEYPLSEELVESFRKL